mgnify:CR=1 FL=1
MSFLPIAEISPYRTGWTLKGNVTFRQETRSFSSERKPGQVASTEMQRPGW